jgi:hypothetical protein
MRGLDEVERGRKAPGQAQVPGDGEPLGRRVAGQTTGGERIGGRQARSDSTIPGAFHLQHGGQASFGRGRSA